MRYLCIVAAILMLILTAACGPNLSNTVPTVDPGAATTEPTVTPNPDQADEGTAEATGETTAEATAEDTGALETAFAIQITGDTEVTITSETGGEVVDTMSGASDENQGLAAADTGTDTESANTSGQSVLNTPPSELRILRFTDADQGYMFELTVTDELPPGQYEIGINNVQTTIGDNINQNSEGATTTDGSPAGGDGTTPQAGGNTGAQQDTAATEATSGNDQTDSANNLSGPPDSAPDQGIVERDEAFAPTIAARLEPLDGEGVSYNLVQSGTLRVEIMNETRASGSFEFTLSPAENPEQTISVTGTFVDVPLSQSEQDN